MKFIFATTEQRRFADILTRAIASISPHPGKPDRETSHSIGQKRSRSSRPPRSLAKARWRAARCGINVISCGLCGETSRTGCLDVFGFTSEQRCHFTGKILRGERRGARVPTPSAGKRRTDELMSA